MARSRILKGEASKIGSREGLGFWKGVRVVAQSGAVFQLGSCGSFAYCLVFFKDAKAYGAFFGHAE
jgi:hypothetical protein